MSLFSYTVPFCFQEYCRRGQEALKKMDRWEDFSSVDVHSYRVKLQTYKDQLEEFCTQLDENRHRICETVRLYEFFDKVRQGICKSICKKLARTQSRAWVFVKDVKCSVCTNRELDL